MYTVCIVLIHMEAAMRTKVSCPDCNGVGSLAYRPCGHAGCCPCPEYADACPTCQGRGEWVECERCEEDPVEGEERFCRLCAEVIAREDQWMNEQMEMHR